MKLAYIRLTDFKLTGMWQVVFDEWPSVIYYNNDNDNN